LKDTKMINNVCNSKKISPFYLITNNNSSVNSNINRNKVKTITLKFNHDIINNQEDKDIKNKIKPQYNLYNNPINHNQNNFEDDKSPFEVRHFETLKHIEDIHKEELKYKRNLLPEFEMETNNHKKLNNQNSSYLSNSQGGISKSIFISNNNSLNNSKDEANENNEKIINKNTIIKVIPSNLIDNNKSNNKSNYVSIIKKKDLSNNFDKKVKKTTQSQAISSSKDIIIKTKNKNLIKKDNITNTNSNNINKKSNKSNEFLNTIVKKQKTVNKHTKPITPPLTEKKNELIERQFKSHKLIKINTIDIANEIRNENRTKINELSPNRLLNKNRENNENNENKAKEAKEVNKASEANDKLIDFNPNLITDFTQNTYSKDRNTGSTESERLLGEKFSFQNKTNEEGSQEFQIKHNSKENIFYKENKLTQNSTNNKESYERVNSKTNNKQVISNIINSNNQFKTRLSDEESGFSIGSNSFQHNNGIYFYNIILHREINI